MSNQVKSEVKLNCVGDTRGMHPNSRKNLRSDANPRGRPRKPFCLIDCFKDELAKMSFNGKETNEQIIAGVVVNMAARGNLKAVELLMSYLHAKPTASMELSSADGKPLQSFIFQMADGTAKTASELAHE